MMIMLPAIVILFGFRCDAPFNVQFSIEQLRPSLPERSVALLYRMNFTELFWRNTDAMDKFGFDQCRYVQSVSSMFHSFAQWRTERTRVRRNQCLIRELKPATKKSFP